MAAFALLLGLALAAPAPAPAAEATLLLDTAYEPAVEAAIDGAQREVVVGMYLFKADGPPTSRPRALVRHLREAVRRGVRVRVVLETDGRPGQEVARLNHATAVQLRDAGVEVLFDSPRRRSHGKFVVVDRRLCFVGSHNWTQSALHYNHEVSVRLD
ncbi:MAG: phospholipase, partial [Nitrospirae bacterium]